MRSNITRRTALAALGAGAVASPALAATGPVEPDPAVAAARLYLSAHRRREALATMYAKAESAAFADTPVPEPLKGARFGSRNAVATHADINRHFDARDRAQLYAPAAERAELAEQRVALHAALDAYDAAVQAADGRHRLDRLDGLVDAADAREKAALTTLTATPANSLAGLAAKIEAAAVALSQLDPLYDIPDEVRIVVACAADASALSGQAPASAA